MLIASSLECMSKLSLEIVSTGLVRSLLSIRLFFIPALIYTLGTFCDTTHTS